MAPGGKSLEGTLRTDNVPLDDEDIFELNGFKKPAGGEAVAPPEVDDEIINRISEAVSAVRVVRRGERDLTVKKSGEIIRLSFSWFELKVEGAPRARVLDVERFIRNHLLAFKVIENTSDNHASGLASEPTERLAVVWEHLCHQYAAVRQCIAPWGARVLPFIGSSFSERTLLNLEVMLNVRRWENLKEFTAFGTAFGGQVEGPFEKFMSSNDNRFRYYASIMAALHLGLQ